MRAKRLLGLALYTNSAPVGGRLVALIAVIVIGLIIADVLHQKHCHGSASHKCESYEFMGDRLTF